MERQRQRNDRVLASMGIYVFNNAFLCAQLERDAAYAAVSGATVRRSILFSKVRVAEGSLVEDSLVLPDVTIGRGVTLRRVVVDKRCHLPDGFTAGIRPDEDRARFHVTERGVTLITPSMLGEQTG